MLKIKSILTVVSIFFFSWFFFFALTQGINFFWEDVYLFENQNSSVLIQPKLFFSTIFDSKTLYGIETMYRPLQRIYWGTISQVFGKNALLFRMHNAVIPAILATLIFLVVRKYKQNIFFDLSAVVYFIVSDALLITILYTHDTRMYMHFFTVISLFLFLVYLSEPRVWLQYLLALGITVISRLSLLFKHEGRIVFPIIILFSLFRRRDLFKQHSFLFLLGTLAIATLPLFCLTGSCKLDVSPSDNSMISAITNFFLKFYTVIYFIGFPIFVVLIVNLLLILYFVLSKYNLNKNLLNLVSICFIWFFFELLLVYATKRFELELYLGATLQRIDFAIVQFPLTLLIFLTTALISDAVKIHSKLIRTLILAFFIIFIGISIGFHAKNLNSWRGGWGEYFLGWNQIREYIDTKTNNSLLILNKPNYDIPFISFSTNKAVMKNVMDLNYVLSVSGDYSKIFGADRGDLPESNAFQNCKSFVTQDNTIYGTLKKQIFGIKAKQKFELCEYNIEFIRKLNSILPS